VRKNYYAYRRIRNFACMEIHPQAKKLLVYLKTDPKSITLEPGFTRDMSKIGHFGTGDLEATIGNHSDFEQAQ
jgi:predicted transport protein